MDAKKKLLPYESLIIGSIGGTVETLIQMPLLTYKFCLQNNTKLPRTFSLWYKGAAIQSSTVAPITAFQMMSNTLLTNHFITDNNVTYKEKVTIASISGGFSSLIYSPIDLITIQQQIHRQNIRNTTRFILQQYNFTTFFKGLSPCIIRESVYTGGYLGLAPVISHSLQNNLDIDKSKTNLIGSVVTGTLSSLITHPFDTTKTVIQSNLGKNLKLFPTMKDLYNTYGIRHLYRGALPRVLRACGAFTICMHLEEAYLNRKNFS
jgi:hypothetical protein